VKEIWLLNFLARRDSAGVHKVFLPQGSSLLHLRIVEIVPRGLLIFLDQEFIHSGNWNSVIVFSYKS